MGVKCGCLREEYRLRVFEIMVLRRIFGPKKDTVTEEWRRVPNEELYGLYCPPNIVHVIKSRRKGSYSLCGGERGIYRVLVGNLSERDHMEDQGVAGRIILKCILKIWAGRGYGLG